MPKDKEDSEKDMKSQGLTVIDGDKAETKADKPQLGSTKHGLTYKQETFAQLVAEGKTLAEAYRTAYDASAMKPSHIYSEASRMRSKDKIAARIDALVDKRMRKKSHDAARTRAFILDQLMEIAENEKTTPANRIKALELLGKVDTVGLFKERVENETIKRSPEQVEREIKQRLAKFVGETS